ncbi:MerR family DNA-binding protein [Amycolatopsis echigonensis]|uniref:MerR family DNA-binding protein n=1 Tax=Amycolatopsis echigonensis TaxID=2576905 RepID=UPI0026A56020
MRRIRELLAAGLPTATIAEIGSCVRDEPLTPACDGVLEKLRGERDRIDAPLARLQSSRAALDTVIQRRAAT